MTAENQNIELWQGDSFRRVFTVREGGAIKDITSATAEWGFARPDGDLIYDDSDAGITATVTDAAAGEVTVEVGSSVTESLSGDYYHELELTDVDGDTATVATGIMTVNADIVD